MKTRPKAPAKPRPPLRAELGEAPKRFADPKVRRELAELIARLMAEGRV